MEIANAGEIRALSLAVFDRTFAVTYALELAAVAIGLVGLSSSFGALVLARRREFGVLRHLGMTRRQIGAMLATEGLVTSGARRRRGMGSDSRSASSSSTSSTGNRSTGGWRSACRGWSSRGSLARHALAMLTALASGRYALDADVVRAVKEDW